MLIGRAWCCACFSGRVEPPILDPALPPPAASSDSWAGASVGFVAGEDCAAFLLEKSDSGAAPPFDLVGAATCVDDGA